jgi:DNA-binding MarR family transcriptional regulator
MNNVTQKEFKVIEAISENSNISQRDIAGKSGMSLGLANILINRLIKKGYLKAKKLNARKVSYMVTPKGLKQKARRSYHFMKKNFSVILKLRQIIEDYARKKYTQGNRTFIVTGVGELADITELVLKSLDLEGLQIKRNLKSGKTEKGGVVFDTDIESSPEERDGYINIGLKAQKLYGGEYEF